MLSPSLMVFLCESTWILTSSVGSVKTQVSIIIISDSVYPTPFRMLRVKKMKQGQRSFHAQTIYSVENQVQMKMLHKPVASTQLSCQRTQVCSQGVGLKDLSRNNKSTHDFLFFFLTLLAVSFSFPPLFLMFAFLVVEIAVMSKLGKLCFPPATRYPQIKIAN